MKFLVLPKTGAKKSSKCYANRLNGLQISNGSKRLLLLQYVLAEGETATADISCTRQNCPRGILLLALRYLAAFSTILPEIYDKRDEEEEGEGEQVFVCKVTSSEG